MNSKIKSRDEMIEVSEKLRDDGKIIVATNGCFDILHIAHINLLEKAKKEGDVLVVMLNSDASIKSFKSDDRPIYSQNERAKMLASLEVVDYVVIFEEDDPLELVKELKPHKVAKGGTYIPEKTASHEVALKEWGGEFVAFPLEEGPSSSNVIDRILGNYGKEA